MNVAFNRPSTKGIGKVYGHKPEKPLNSTTSRLIPEKNMISRMKIRRSSLRWRLSLKVYERIQNGSRLNHRRRILRKRKNDNCGSYIPELTGRKSRISLVLPAL